MARRTKTSLSLALLAAGLAFSLTSTGMAQPTDDKAVPTGSSSQAVASASIPDGTVTLSGGSVAAGIGFVWGNGKLVFQGRQHDFDVHGLSVLDVGAAGFTATGTVQNLRRLEDFSGNYVAASAGITVAGGGSAVYLKNQNGVVIQLDATTQGLRLNLAGEGIKVALN